MDIRAIKLKLFEIIEPVASDRGAESGLEVVDISLAREAVGWVLRVYLERASESENERSVTLSDCAEVSRELSAVLDVNDPIPCAYSLEVSSAGLDRPLRTASHFERFRGQTAKVRLEVALEGRKNFTGVIGQIEGDDGAETLTLDVDGRPATVPLSAIASARLIPNWDALLGKSGSTDAAAKPAKPRKPRKDASKDPSNETRAK